MSIGGLSSWRARNSSVIDLVPEPGSRRSHGRSPSSSTGTERRRASGSPGAVISRIGLSRKASPESSPSAGGRPPIATSALWLATSRNTRSRLPTSSVSVSSGSAGRELLHELGDDVLGGGRDRRDSELAGGGARRLARGAAALVEQADHMRREGGERPAGGARLDAAAQPVRQLDAELLGERGHGGRDRWLGDIELLRSRGHRPALHNREEAPQLRQCDSHLANCTAEVLEKEF